MNANIDRDPLSRVGRFTLHEAVGHALRAHTPTRIVHDDGEAIAEIYVNKGYVIHANVNGLFGIPAIAALVAEELEYDVEYEVWPSRCTLLASWEALCHEAKRHRTRVDTFVELRDDDATVPLDR